jgi:hypothetical protein
MKARSGNVQRGDAPARQREAAGKPHRTAPEGARDRALHHQPPALLAARLPTVASSIQARIAAVPACRRFSSATTASAAKGASIPSTSKPGFAAK